MSDRREEIIKKVFEDYVKANPSEKWLSFDEVKSCGTADIVYGCMDEYMRLTCLELLEYMAKNEVICVNAVGDKRFYYKGVFISSEELFENFL